MRREDIMKSKDPELQSVVESMTKEAFEAGELSAETEYNLKELEKKLNLSPESVPSVKQQIKKQETTEGITDTFTESFWNTRFFSKQNRIPGLPESPQELEAYKAELEFGSTIHNTEDQLEVRRFYYDRTESLVDAEDLIHSKELASGTEALRGRTVNDPLEFLRGEEYNVATTYNIDPVFQAQIDEVLQEAGHDLQHQQDLLDFDESQDPLDALEAILTRSVEEKQAPEHPDLIEQEKLAAQEEVAPDDPSARAVVEPEPEPEEDPSWDVDVDGPLPDTALPEELTYEYLTKNQVSAQQMRQSILDFVRKNVSIGPNEDLDAMMRENQRGLLDLEEVPEVEQVPMAKEFLERMKLAHPTPQKELYETSIVSYVESLHLRQALIVFDDMKNQGLTPSAEVYCTLIEGYYSNFDLAGGESLAEEMKSLYPDVTPPQFTLGTQVYTSTKS